MANKITYTNIDPVGSYLASVSSRYAKSAVIYYGDNQYMTFATYKRNSLTPLGKDKHSIIPPGMEYRPDKVSQMAYGSPNLWYKIMEANNIFDIMDFKAGRNIIIPGAIL